MRIHAALAMEFLVGTFFLTGCMSSMPHLTNPLSTAASMRVEVEVYKGPLSKNVSVQWGELKGLVHETEKGLIPFKYLLVSLASEFDEGQAMINDSSEDFKWSCRKTNGKNIKALLACRQLSDIYNHIQAIIEDLHEIYQDISLPPIVVGHLKNLLDEVVENFNRVHTPIIAAKDKVDLLKNSCADACDFRETLLAIRLDLEEAKGILKSNKILWNSSKNASRELEATLSEIEGAPAVKIIAEKAIELAQRINEGILRSIESVEGKVSQVAAETHLLTFATHQLTAVEWSSELERAANEIGQLPDFISKQVRGYQGTSATGIQRPKHEVMSFERRKHIMERVGSVAMKLKAKALVLVEVSNMIAPERKLRLLVAFFARFASEYSNQLESMADALQWQLGEEGKGINAKQLPLSLYLRNAETTDFLNLYTWKRAVAPAIWEEMLLHPFTAFSSDETTDRVRVIERLFADHNWEKINTVYGSGQGNFAMALVKDEIGNWNLKSFDSDPTELLDAYKKFTVASISKASSLLTPSGRLLESLLPSIGDLTRGQVGGARKPFNALRMETLHKQVVEKLRAIKAPAQGTNANAHTKVIQQILDVLNGYEATIDMLQESLITSNSQQTM